MNTKASTKWNILELSTFLTWHFPLSECLQRAEFNFHTKILIQSTFAISNTRYLKLPLSQNFSSVPSAASVTAPINSFGISNSAISNFHNVELFSRFLQGFLGVFSIGFLEHFYFPHLNVERIHPKTSMECSSVHISTQQNVDLNHCLSLMSQMLENNQVL